VDILFIGPGDMSLRLGCTPSVNDPVMMDVQKQIAAACQKHGKAWGRPVGTAADAKTLIDLGAQFIVHGAEFSAVCAHFAVCSAEFDSILGEVAGALAIPAGKTY
jgi:2-keto-3-deoxy-L-rhamnonate aldolase RhmA